MYIAHKMQKVQDWVTQQWIIFLGRKFNPLKEDWLMGPFGEIAQSYESFIIQLAEKENLTIRRNLQCGGLLSSIELLNLPDNQLKNLSEKIINFYENTTAYKIKFEVKWNPFFKGFAYIINRLFSQRIKQLHIPLKNKVQQNLLGEIIELVDFSNTVKYKIWLRKHENSGEIVFFGIYGTCQLSDEQTCIKAIFPLPKGNATVIMRPSVGKKQELILDASGNKFGKEGFYFLLNDSKNNHWVRFISSFRNKLIISESNKKITAKQLLTLWRLKVAEFYYFIEE